MVLRDRTRAWFKSSTASALRCRISESDPERCFAEPHMDTARRSRRTRDQIVLVVVLLEQGLNRERGRGGGEFAQPTETLTDSTIVQWPFCEEDDRLLDSKLAIERRRGSRLLFKSFF